jgi:hypothetical protein
MAAKKKKTKPKPRVAKHKKKVAAKPKKRAIKKVKKVKKAKKPLAVATVRRRDRAGHIDPTYGKQLRAQGGKGGKKEATRPAFNLASDDLAEELGEEVVGKATSGEDEGEDVANQEVDEEVGGPFVVTTGGEEYAEGTDESNPEDAEVEPFPKT